VKARSSVYRAARNLGILLVVLAATLVLGGCSSNVGVGVSVGVPVGSHGRVSVGTSRWF
jgi:hypothetical protein